MSLQTDCRLDVAIATLATPPPPHACPPRPQHTKIVQDKYITMHLTPSHLPPHLLSTLSSPSHLPSSFLTLLRSPCPLMIFIHFSSSYSHLSHICPNHSSTCLSYLPFNTPLSLFTQQQQQCQHSPWLKLCRNVCKRTKQKCILRIRT